MKILKLAGVLALITVTASVFSIGSSEADAQGPPAQGVGGTSPAKGPTTREVELQKSIDAMEARQRELQAEIERLKREKGGAK